MKVPSLQSIPGLASVADAAADALGNLTARIPEHLKTITTSQQHVLIVTHAVPVARVRRLVPAHFELDTLKIDGEICAFLQVVCAFNDNLHYTPLPKPSLDFWQLTYRVLTRQRFAENAPSQNAAPANAAATGANAPTAPASTRSALRGTPGAFVVKSYTGAKAASMLQSAVVAQSQFAQFNVLMRGDTARGEYSLMAIDAREESAPAMQSAAATQVQGATVHTPPQNAPDTPSAPTQIAARTLPPDAPRVLAAPFASREKMVEFLTLRPDLFQAARLGNATLMQSIEALPMQPLDAGLVPVGGEVQDIRLAVWEEMGLLSQKEMRGAYSVLLQPSWNVLMNVPRVISLVAAETTTVRVI